MRERLEHILYQVSRHMYVPVIFIGIFIFFAKGKNNVEKIANKIVGFLLLLSGIISMIIFNS